MKDLRRKLTFPVLCLAIGLVVFGVSYTMLGQSEEAPDVFEALASGDLTELQRALDQGGDPNLVEDGITPLHMALMLTPVSEVSYGQIKALLAGGANPNITDDVGWTALHYAAKFDGGNSITQLLVDHGADAAIRSQQGVIAIHLAAIFGDVGAMAVLEEASHLRPNEYAKIKAVGLAHNEAESGATEEARKQIFTQELVELVNDGVISEKYREAALQGWAMSATCATCD